MRACLHQVSERPFITACVNPPEAEPLASWLSGKVGQVSEMFHFESGRRRSEWWRCAGVQVQVRIPRFASRLQIAAVYLPKLAHISTCMLAVFICKRRQKRGGSLGGLRGSVSGMVKLSRALSSSSPAPPCPATSLSFHLLLWLRGHLWPVELSNLARCTWKKFDNCKEVIQ